MTNKTVHIVQSARRIDGNPDTTSLCGSKVTVIKLDDWWNQGKLCPDCHKKSLESKNMQNFYVLEK